MLKKSAVIQETVVQFHQKYRRTNDLTFLCNLKGGDKKQANIYPDASAIKLFVFPLRGKGTANFISDRSKILNIYKAQFHQRQ